MVRLFQIVGEALPGSTAVSNSLRARLIQAGYRLPSALPIFRGVKCASAVACTLLVPWVLPEYSARAAVALVAVFGFGYLLPDRILHRVARARGARLRHALPGALDMFLLAVEAGQSIEQALAATCRGLKCTSPDLAAELTVLQLESHASNNRAEAIRNFALRNREPELKKFAALLIDSDRFGTSIGPALRDHAKDLRIRLRQKAQESARKLAAKLIFPVFFLIFPSVLLVTFGPAVILISAQMRNLLGN
jgi:tight adherence protein C